MEEIDADVLADVEGTFALISGVVLVDPGAAITFGESAIGTRGELDAIDRCRPLAAILGEIAIGAGLINLFFRFTWKLAFFVASTAFRRCCSVSAVSSISTSLLSGKFIRLAGVTAADPTVASETTEDKGFRGGGMLISFTPSRINDDLRLVEMTGEDVPEFFIEVDDGRRDGFIEGDCLITFEFCWREAI